MSKVDFTKPVRFRPGVNLKLVRIVAHDLPGDCSVCAVVIGAQSEYANTFDPDEFENIPPEPIVRYVNLYSSGNIGDDYKTRALADEAADSTRIACKRITEGQFDE